MVEIAQVGNSAERKKIDVAVDLVVKLVEDANRFDSDGILLGQSGGVETRNGKSISMREGRAWE